MSEILIFGGTTEGRELTEFCERNKISACVSVTTDYGAALIEKSGYVRVINGRLDKREIGELISKNGFDIVIDATHPYAVLATENIRAGCGETGALYYRLKRASGNELKGTVLNNLSELICYLNDSEGTVLSTLGSKELPALTEVRGYPQRIWVRVLPVENIRDYCRNYGFDEKKIILGKGPFSVEENIAHIEKSGAQILVTKESGAAGGYPEKAEVAERLGIELVTIKRPEESGYGIDEIKEIILRTEK